MYLYYNDKHYIYKYNVYHLMWSLLLLSDLLTSDTLNNPNPNRLLHIPNSKPTQRWIFLISFQTHGFSRPHNNNSTISCLQQLRVIFHHLPCPSVYSTL